MCQAQKCTRFVQRKVGNLVEIGSCFTLLWKSIGTGAPLYYKICGILSALKKGNASKSRRGQPVNLRSHLLREIWDILLSGNRIHLSR